MQLFDSVEIQAYAEHKLYSMMAFLEVYELQRTSHTRILQTFIIMWIVFPLVLFPLAHSVDIYRAIKRDFRQFLRRFIRIIHQDYALISHFMVMIHNFTMIAVDSSMQMFMPSIDEGTVFLVLFRVFLPMLGMVFVLFYIDKPPSLWKTYLITKAQLLVSLYFTHRFEQLFDQLVQILVPELITQYTNYQKISTVVCEALITVLLVFKLIIRPFKRCKKRMCWYERNEHPINFVEKENDMLLDI